MTTRSHSILAMAAALALGGAAFCTAQQDNAQAQQQNRQAREQQEAGQQDLAQMRQQGQQVDQQIMQQLRQIREQGGQDASDKLFVLNAALESQAESVYSQQAAQKSQNQQVKQIAQREIQDHQQINQQLQQVSQQLQMQVPQGLPAMKVEEIDIMSSLPSEQLDRCYIAHLNAVHAKQVAAFRAESQIAQNQQVKQFASQVLPTLQQHHRELMQAGMQMGILGQGGEAQPAGSEIRGSGNDRTNRGTDRGSGGSGNGAGDGTAK